MSRYITTPAEGLQWATADTLCNLKIVFTSPYIAEVNDKTDALNKIEESKRGNKSMLSDEAQVDIEDFIKNINAELGS